MLEIGIGVYGLAVPLIFAALPTVYHFFWQSLQAAAIIVALPIAFAFNLLLERFIAGEE